MFKNIRRGGNDGRLRIQALTVTQSVTNSTVFVDITELVMPLKANTVYFFQIFGKNEMSSGTANDIQYSVVVPSGADVRFGVSSANTFILIQGGVSTGVFNATINQESTYLWGIIVMGSTAGNFQPQFTQFVAGNTTRLLEGTNVRMYELGGT